RFSCGLAADFAIAAPTPLDVDASLLAGRMRYNSGGAAECLDTFAGAGCGDVELTARLVRHCSNVVQPRVGPGGTCFGHAECLGGSCDLANGCRGACVPWPPPGASCESGMIGCDPTVEFCGAAPPSTALVCSPKKHAGDACAADVECAFDLICNTGKCL